MLKVRSMKGEGELAPVGRVGFRDLEACSQGEEGLDALEVKDTCLITKWIVALLS